jgi:hypothetical protein
VRLRGAWRVSVLALCPADTRSRVCTRAHAVAPALCDVAPAALADLQRRCDEGRGYALFYLRVLVFGLTVSALS